MFYSEKHSQEEGISGYPTFALKSDNVQCYEKNKIKIINKTSYMSDWPY